MKSHTLPVANRTETGRKVKALRKAGSIPATVYGKGLASKSVTVSTEGFSKVYSQTGETGLISLTLGSESLPVLVHHVQRHPVKGFLLHVEFHQVNLKEKVKAHVPVVSVNKAPAEEQKTGVLLMLVSDVEVEAYPADLPEHLTADVSKLTEIGQEIRVSDLLVPGGVTVLTDGSIAVAKISELVSKEAEAQVAAEEAAAAATAESADAEPVTNDASQSDSPAPAAEAEKKA